MPTTDTLRTPDRHAERAPATEDPTDVLQQALAQPLETRGPFVKLPDEVVHADQVIAFMEALRRRP